MIGLPKGMKFFYKLHRAQIKPPYPVLLPCPGCGRYFLRVNAHTVEISNTGGPKWDELMARDAWSEQKHTCGTKIVMYWKD